MSEHEDLKEMFFGGINIAKKTDKNNWKIKYLDYTLLVPNPLNQYSQSHEMNESLRESIKKNGIRQNLEVIYNDKTGLYDIITGETRYRTTKELVEQEERNDLRDIPCRIIDITHDKDYKSLSYDALITSYIIQSNKQRKKQIADHIFEYNHYAKVNEKMNGGKNKHRFVSRQMGVSETTLQRMLYIADNLSDELLGEVNKGALAVSVAYKIAQKETDVQTVAMDTLKATGKITVKDIANICSTEQAEGKEKTSYPCVFPSDELNVLKNELQEQIDILKTPKTITATKYNDLLKQKERAEKELVAFTDKLKYYLEREGK